MAELTVFSYRPGGSIIHTLDVRFKLILLVLLSLASMNAHFQTLAVLSLAAVGCLINTRQPFRSLLIELRYFLILLSFIFVARAITISATPFEQTGLLSFTRQGLYGGVMVCWRLLLIVLFGLSFISTTRTSAIKSAVEWFLKPVPFVAEKKVATMLSLLIRFVPVILDQARKTAEAQKARGVENRKNPIYRLKMLGIPVLRRIFENAENLITALEARCFSEKRTGPELSATPKDWFVLLITGIFCAVIVLWQRLWLM